MRTFLYIGYLFIFIGTMGCDPMRRIQMRNSTGEEASISFHFKEDSLHSSPLFLGSSKEQIFSLQSQKPGNYIPLSVGIGTWTPAYLRSIADDLEAMEIKWNQGRIRLEGEEDIYQYLVKRRKGFKKDKILIHVNNQTSEVPNP